MIYKIMDGYKSIMDLRTTEKAIKEIKDCFQLELSKELSLQRVSAPRFVKKGTGVNDDLSGTERKASFQILAIPGPQFELVFSLAKWKRAALKDYGFVSGEGLYTDMDAIRPDEEDLDAIHSVYVDQWDWEKIIDWDERSIDYLKKTVQSIYSVLKQTELMVEEKYKIKSFLPDSITFIHAEDALKAYPDLSPKEREFELAKKYGSVFIIGIGSKLSDGKVHDVRAPDYDDWSTEYTDGKFGLNGDIIVWHPVLKREFELSSMGIRVDKKSLMRQLEISDSMDKLELDWHKRLLSGELPQTIGGGIGQSRLCMLLLRKAHIGEVQASIWPESTMKECSKKGISLL